MPRGKKLSPYVRTKICEAKACGLTYQQLHYTIKLQNTQSNHLEKEQIRHENASRHKVDAYEKLMNKSMIA
jgi:hypothetical protein